LTQESNTKDASSTQRRV